MTPQQLVGLAARLFAVWLAITSFQAIGIGQAIKSQGGAQDTAWVPYLFAALYLVGALLLWFFPMFIAHKLVPRTKLENTLRLPSEQVVVVACVALGLLVIVHRALPSISAYLSLAAFWVANGQPVSTMETGRHIDGLAGFIQLVVGLFLVAKAHMLTSIILPRE